MDVAHAAVGVDQLTQQQGTPVAQARDETAELMAGVGLRHRGGPAGKRVAHQETQPVGASQP